MVKTPEQTFRPDSAKNIDEVNQRKYFADLALGYLSLIKMHKESGHLPSPKNLSSQKKAANIESSGQEDWSNIVRHCLAEAGAADAVARLINLTEKERAQLIEAAILHDFDKKIQVEAFRADPARKKENYYRLLEEGTKTLEAHGVDPAVIEIIKSVGHERSKEVLENKIPLLSKILHYLDGITEGTQLVSPQSKLEGMRQRYPELFKAGEFKDWVASKEKIQEELATRMGLEDPNQLPNFISQKVKQLASEEAKK